MRAVEWKNSLGQHVNSSSSTVDLPLASTIGRRLIVRAPLLFLALALGIYSAFSFQHKCSLGVKWLENHTIWLLPLAYGVVCLVPRRLWLAIASLTLLIVLVNYGLAPVYLAAIHPNGEG